MQTPDSPRPPPAHGGADRIQDLIDHRPFGGWQWVVMALCFTIVLLDGFDTAAIGYIAPSLLTEWGLAKPDLAPVLSAALFGLAAGAIGSGPLADRFGRRRVLNGSVLVFGLACWASAFSGSLTELTLLRFVTGIGLGAAMPNAVTLVSEYAPARTRAMLTSLMFCGFPLGAALGGFLAAWMIPHFGWRSVLELGGTVPLLLLVLMLVWLPESIGFMARHPARFPAAQVTRTLRRMVGSGLDATALQAPPAMTPAAHTTASASAGTVETGGIAQVLSPRFRTGTLMLWLTYFMGLVIFYALINWMPVLFREAGLDASSATLITALFPLGGVGSIALGWLMDRYNANRVVAICFALTAVLIALIGQSVGTVSGLVVVVFVAGAVMNTAQSSLPALAATWYPTSCRATGVAWMLGFGRFGGIAGSFLVAQLAALQVGFAGIFLVVALPAVVCTVALLVKQAAHPQVTPEPRLDTAPQG